MLIKAVPLKTLINNLDNTLIGLLGNHSTTETHSCTGGDKRSDFALFMYNGNYFPLPKWHMSMCL